MILSLAFVALALATDTDGDGLSDFHERHKYRTDPEHADSDGDGVPDGDWSERREYAYTVRTVVDVMRPVTPEFLTDDYQDARVLDVDERIVQLEVIHYPFSTVAEALEESASVGDTAALEAWLAPGPTADWDEELARELRAALAKDGIDATKRLDRDRVVRIAQWLVDYADSGDLSMGFVAAFDGEGKAFVPGELRAYAEREAEEASASIDELLAAEVSAKGMFARRQRGSCTPSAMYLSGCLRALGIPTRTVLCIPAIDASDEREHRLAREGLRHPEVRRIVLGAAERGRNSWTSHTFNEVWLDGRWWRLNYDRLGQGTLDPWFLGLMTHVATFRDWADARMPETIGRRQVLKERDARLDGTNPYSTVSISDRFGVHSGIEVPAAAMPETLDQLEIAELTWTDDPALREKIRESCLERGRFGLIATIHDVPDMDVMRGFFRRADLRLFLDAPAAKRLELDLNDGCWWFSNGRVDIWVPMYAEEQRSLRKETDYVARARNDTEGARWDVELVVRRPLAFR